MAGRITREHGIGRLEREVGDLYDRLQAAHEERDAARAELAESRAQCDEYAERVREFAAQLDTERRERISHCEEKGRATGEAAKWREVAMRLKVALWWEHKLWKLCDVAWVRRDAWAKRWKACAKGWRWRYMVIVKTCNNLMKEKSHALGAVETHRQSLRAVFAIVKRGRDADSQRAAEELLRREPWLETKR